jgi:hypothetical protein
MTKEDKVQWQMRSTASALLAQNEELFYAAKKVVNKAVEASQGNAARASELLEDAMAMQAAADAALQQRGRAPKPFLDMLFGSR